jgi:DNA-binding transcriptional ArsR family regulator
MPSLSDLTQTHKALAHPARLRVLAMLRGGELCACQITAVLGLAPSTVSAHLAELRRAGLVDERKSGRWVHYRLAGTHAAAGVLEPLWQQLKRDTQIRSDTAVVRRLRAVSLEQLCSVDLDLAQLAIPRAGGGRL